MLENPSKEYLNVVMNLYSLVANVVGLNVCVYACVNQLTLVTFDL